MQKPEVKALMKRLQAHLDLFEPDNCQIALKGGTYSDNNISSRIVISVKGDDGEIVTKEAEDFKRYATTYGLKPEDLGERFQDFNQKEFEIVGCKPRSRKYPILVKEVRTGKLVKFGHKAVKSYLELRGAKK
jgi:hypothetical protein